MFFHLKLISGKFFQMFDGQMLHQCGDVNVNIDTLKNDINKAALRYGRDSSSLTPLRKNIGPVLAGFGVGFHLGCGNWSRDKLLNF